MTKHTADESESLEMQMRGATPVGRALAPNEDRLSGLVSAHVTCLLAAQNCRDSSLRSSWLSAAESYAVLKQPVRAFNPGQANARTDRRSGDSNCMPPLQARTIDDLYLASCIAYQSRLLQHPRRDRDGRPVNAEHLAEKFVRERKAISVDAIMGVQQPSCATFLHLVQAIAGR